MTNQRRKTNGKRLKRSSKTHQLERFEVLHLVSPKGDNAALVKGHLAVTEALPSILQQWHHGSRVLLASASLLQPLAVPKVLPKN